MDCEQVSSLSPVTFAGGAGGGGGEWGGGIADEMRSGFPDKNINYRPRRCRENDPAEEPKPEDSHPEVGAP